MRKKGQQISVQERLPLIDMRAWLATMADGTLRGFLRLPCKNESLVTEAACERDAAKLADVFSSIKVPFALLKYPMPVSSSAYLVQIDRAISRERAKLNEARFEEEAEACRIKISVLEGFMRSDAKYESSAGDRIQFPTYLVLKFDGGKTELEAKREMDNLVRVATEKLGKPPQRVDSAEFVQLCGLYFSPQSSGAEACIFDAGIIMPKMGRESSTAS